MFLIRYLKTSFQFKAMFSRTDEKTWKMVIYFLLLALINAFPLNYLIVREQGWRLNFVEEAFTQEMPDWTLPEDCEIVFGTLNCTTDQSYLFEHHGMTYVFNAQTDDTDETIKQILFYEDRIVYHNGQGARMTAYDYQGFETDLDFLSINLMEGTERHQAYIAFGQSIEASFSPYIVFYTVLVNTSISIGLNLMFILLMALAIQLFRFGYSSFFSFGGSIKFMIYIMGLPALISFVVGFIEPAFSPVFFQFGMGLITMVNMLVNGKKVFA